MTDEGRNVDEVSGHALFISSPGPVNGDERVTQIDDHVEDQHATRKTLGGGNARTSFITENVFPGEIDRNRDSDRDSRPKDNTSLASNTDVCTDAAVSEKGKTNEQSGLSRLDDDDKTAAPRDTSAAGAKEKENSQDSRSTFIKTECNNSREEYTQRRRSSSMVLSDESSLDKTEQGSSENVARKTETEQGSEERKREEDVPRCSCGPREEGSGVREGDGAEQTRVRLRPKSDYTQQEGVCECRQRLNRCTGENELCGGHLQKPLASLDSCHIQYSGEPCSGSTNQPANGLNDGQEAAGLDRRRVVSTQNEIGCMNQHPQASCTSREFTEASDIHLPNTSTDSSVRTHHDTHNPHPVVPAGPESRFSAAQIEHNHSEGRGYVTTLTIHRTDSNSASTPSVLDNRPALAGSSSFGSSQIELKTFSPTGDYSTPNNEPVLMLYKRHSDDPFYNYDARAIANDAPTEQETDSSSPGITETNASPRAVPRLAVNGLEVDPADITQVTIGDGTYVEGRSRSSKAHRRRDDDRDGSHLSLTQIQVNVAKPYKRSMMVKLQSQRIQCCLCGCSVFSALIGMFMLSAGVCLVLNYNFLEVDTSGLPQNLHNEEGKKVVGIILICVGIAALGISVLISALYFGACGRSPPPTSSSTNNAHHGKQNGHSSRGGGDTESGSGERRSTGRPTSQESHGKHHHHHHHHHGHYRSNGATPSGASPSVSRRISGGGSMPNIRSGDHPRSGRGLSDGATPPGSSRGDRKSRSGGGSGGGKKSARSHHKGQGRYRNPLAPHPEEAGTETQSLSESSSRRSAGSASRRQLFATEERDGHVNKGATFDDDDSVQQHHHPDNDNQIKETFALGSESSSSSFSPSVIIRVDSSHVDGDGDPHAPTSASPPLRPPATAAARGDLQTEFTQLSGASSKFRVSEEDPSVQKVGRGADDINNDYDDDDGGLRDDEEESGRLSRSPVDSGDILDDSPEGQARAKQRLHDQMSMLLDS